MWFQLKRGARFLRLLQVCVRKHIPQLVSIIYYKWEKCAIYIHIAPSFTVVERPNDWTKEIKKTTAANPTQQQRLEYWQAFNDYAFQNKEFAKAFNKRKPTTDHWMDFSGKECAVK